MGKYTTDQLRDMAREWIAADHAANPLAWRVLYELQSRFGGTFDEIRQRIRVLAR